jgi:hypothetical protein
MNERGRQLHCTHAALLATTYRVCLGTGCFEASHIAMCMPNLQQVQLNNPGYSFVRKGSQEGQ